MQSPQFKKRYPSSPVAEDIYSARLQAQQTQTQAGETVFTSVRQWQKWENDETRMPRAIFEYYLIKTKQKMP